MPTDPRLADKSKRRPVIAAEWGPRRLLTSCLEAPTLGVFVRGDVRKLAMKAGGVLDALTFPPSRIPIRAG